MVYVGRDGSLLSAQPASPWYWQPVVGIVFVFEVIWGFFTSLTVRFYSFFVTRTRLGDFLVVVTRDR